MVLGVDLWVVSFLIRVGSELFVIWFFLLNISLWVNVFLISLDLILFIFLVWFVVLVVFKLENDGWFFGVCVLLGVVVCVEVCDRMLDFECWLRYVLFEFEFEVVMFFEWKEWKLFLFVLDGLRGL